MTSLLNNPMKIHDNAMVGILCDDTMSENYANLLQFNTSWWAFLGPWYYFRLCFSLSSCDYDLTVIKKSHTLNCYLILQKFLLKTKLTNSFLVTVVAQFTAKTLNSGKAIYYLSLLSCSINKLKSQMLFTCNTFVPFDFTCKKIFYSIKWWWWWWWWGTSAPLPPFSTALHSPGLVQFCHWNCWAIFQQVHG